MKSLLTAVLTLGVLAVPAMAQEAPKPGPEQARIAYFKGTWKTEGTTKASPMGPAGKFSSTQTCDWFTGGFQLVCHSKGTNAAGAAVTGEGIYGYDRAAQEYTYYGISSMGDGFLAHGRVAGKVWTWTAESTMNGQALKVRATMTEESPTSYTFKLEMSVGGGGWTVTEEAKVTKQ